MYTIQMFIVRYFQTMLCVALSSPISHVHRVAISDCRKLNEEILDDF